MKGMRKVYADGKLAVKDTYLAVEPNGIGLGLYPYDIATDKSH